MEGLCHISELSDERVAKPEDVVQLGQEMDFKILRIDAEGKKIGLSARTIGKDQPVVDTKVYSSEAGSGMASLGELADFGIARAEPIAEPSPEPSPEPSADISQELSTEPTPEPSQELTPESSEEPAEEPEKKAE